jgi:hypothetical protein
MRTGFAHCVGDSSFELTPYRPLLLEDRLREAPLREDPLRGARVLAALRAACDRLDVVRRRAAVRV